MARGAAEVQQAAFGKDHDAVTIREAPFVVLRFDVDVLDAFDLLQTRHVDFIVEVADVADDRLVLHLRHVLGRDDVLVAGRGDENIRRLNDVFERRHFVAFHRRLQRADRIDLGDDHAAALATQRLRAAFADFAIAENHGNLAAEHHVRGAHQAVG